MLTNRQDTVPSKCIPTHALIKLLYFLMAACLTIYFRLTVANWYQYNRSSSYQLIQGKTAIIDVSDELHIRGMICTLIKNEAKYIREWISFHLLLGVNFFVIYDDNSTDRLMQEIQMFGKSVTVIPWGSSMNGKDLVQHIQSERQISAARDCVLKFSPLSQWLMFLDVDEFVFPCQPNVDDIGFFVQDPSVKLECLKFGFGFEDREPSYDELTIEKHVLRAPYSSLDVNAENITRRFASCQNDPRLCETHGSWKHAYNTEKYPQYRNILARTIGIHGTDAFPVIQKNLTRHNGLCCNHYGYRSTQLSKLKAQKNRNPTLSMVARNKESAAFYNSVLDTNVLRYASKVRNFMADISYRKAF